MLQKDFGLVQAFARLQVYGMHGFKLLGLGPGFEGRSAGLVPAATTLSNSGGSHVDRS